MAEALTRPNLDIESKSIQKESPTKLGSKYKQVHDKWLLSKENNN